MDFGGGEGLRDFQHIVTRAGEDVGGGDGGRLDVDHPKIVGRQTGAGDGGEDCGEPVAEHLDRAGRAGGNRVVQSHGQDELRAVFAVGVPRPRGD